MVIPNSSPPSKVPLERDEYGNPRFHGCSNIREFEFLGKLGEGTFGEVYKARSKRSGAIVALKKILMHNEKDGFPITALREIKLLKMLSHPNVLQLQEMAVERPRGEGRKKPSMYMVTPYMDHDLSGLLENPSVHFTEPQIKCYMLQLLEGLRYLHENKILHRDMKAANLLINNKGILQIADFGLARPYDESPPKPGKGGGEAVREYTTLVVTRWYRPPELLLHLRKYTTAIDMWGVGCVFGEMFKGKPILAGSSDINQAHLIFSLVGTPTEENMPGWSSLPGCDVVKNFGSMQGSLATVFKEQGAGVISLLSELLKLDWRKRINAIDALQHPYFRTPRRQFDNRVPDVAQPQRKLASDEPRGHLPAWQRDSTLPPKPPVSSHHPWTAGQAWRGDSRLEPRRDGPPPRRESGLDSYIPNYDGPADRFKGREDGRRDTAELRDYDRDRSRRRSRSPEPRHRTRSRESNSYYDLHRR
ncbi:serine/threonine-protein kinase bur-1 [Histoplasma capsulatum]|uniref:Serine/threonine-protein kinase BUR1 n=1 Tax=Ajellomyces capsulatus TaxID=5037 RepID=A0A8A1MPN6_AJECA|nr:serine/threonine-protein kinase bur-1 [Histoplasma capsulatum]